MPADFLQNEFVKKFQRQRGNDDSNRPNYRAKKIPNVQAERVAQPDFVQSQKNWNQNPRRALKSKRREQNESKIVVALKIDDVKFVQKIAGQHRKAKTKKLRPQKQEHSFDSPRLFRHAAV